MAYGVKYSCQWTSPMRDKHLYTIEILEKDYTGSVSPLYPTGNVLEIAQGQIDDDEVVALRGSQATLSLLCVDDGEPYAQLFTTDPQRFMLRVTQRRIGSMQMYWQGYLSTSAYSQPYANPPYRVTLKAVDGIALLKDIPFLNSDGARYEGEMSLSTIINETMGHITDDSVKFMPYAPLKPAQQGHTLDMVGVVAEALYSTFGEQTPSCYEVLESVLKTMGLQLFMSYGEWVVREITASLTAKNQPVNTLINNGGKSAPIYDDSDDGKGMSSTATLSFLAPYRRMTVSRPEAKENDALNPSMLDKNRWRKINGTFSLAAWSPNKESLRLQVSAPIKQTNSYYGAYYVSDEPISLSPKNSIAVSFDAFSLWSANKSMRVGLFLQAASEDNIGAWLNSLVIGKQGDSGGGTVTSEMDEVVYAWDVIDNKWSKLEGGWAIDIYPRTTMEISVAASGYQPFEIPCPTSRLKATNVSINADGFQTDGAYRLIVVLLGNAVDTMPPIELHNPQINIPQGDIVDDIHFTEIKIASDGLGEVTYDQRYADSWVTLGTGSALEAPLITMSDSQTVRSFVVPAQRGLLADCIASNIQRLRGLVARQLEGEIYVSYPIDLNAIWHDRDGRRYYTNYIKRLVSRGLYYVQLREIPYLPTAHNWEQYIFNQWAFDKVVALDTCAYMTSSNSRALWRWEAATGKAKQIMASPNGTYPLTLNEGQRCASVVAFDGTWYTLIALDTHGNELSRIEHANSLVTFGQPFYEAVIRTATYDANINMWTMVGGDSKVTYIQHISQDGLDLGRATYTAAATSAKDLILMPNGFSFINAPEGQSSWRSLWHNNAVHRPAVVESWRTNVQVVSANEVYMLIRQPGRLLLYARKDSTMGIADTPLIDVYESQWTFCGMNNALVLFRSADGATFQVFDGRTGDILSWPGGILTGKEHIWLCGDYIYYMQHYRTYHYVRRAQILPGVSATNAIITEDVAPNND